ncbi:protein of unknown function [Cardinium endosymbiont cEper1 of Encarsia pergandiella]|nr:protein of unknown function [Cardinium endosymbiont cEper1 of Encarsia pergandiella]
MLINQYKLDHFLLKNKQLYVILRLTKYWPMKNNSISRDRKNNNKNVLFRSIFYQK